jgi:5-methylcytosine-specific restriction endonuclease McrA
MNTKNLYGHRWRKERLHFLRLNPLCVYCLELGATKAAEVVDHIVPHKGSHDLFWDVENWQPLCKRCHDSVKQKEEATGRRVGINALGYPVGGW